MTCGGRLSAQDLIYFTALHSRLVTVNNIRFVVPKRICPLYLACLRGTLYEHEEKALYHFGTKV